MTRHSRNLAVLAVLVAGILPMAAHAQSYSTAYEQPAPFYPHVVQYERPYAVQIGPNTYVFPPPAHMRHYPYVRFAPAVVEAKRYVEDPTHVFVRRHAVEDEQTRSRHDQTVPEDIGRSAGRDDGKKRVIPAEAEITILGPDDMNIRLFRKRHGSEAKTKVNE
jgi:hypothetical protein